MRLPRQVSGDDLVKALRKLGYSASRQTGSHIRLSHEGQPGHHITIPNHEFLKIGTLSAILTDIADYLNTSKADLIKQLF